MANNHSEISKKGNRTEMPSSYVVALLPWKLMWIARTLLRGGPFKNEYLGSGRLGKTNTWVYAKGCFLSMMLYWITNYQLGTAQRRRKTLRLLEMIPGSWLHYNENYPAYSIGMFARGPLTGQEL